jgi:hypothetical protein
VERMGLERGRVLVVLGERDPIIVADELGEDVKEVLGEECVEVHVVKGAGHEVPIERAEEVVSIIERFWRGKLPRVERSERAERAERVERVEEVETRPAESKAPEAKEAESKEVERKDTEREGSIKSKKKKKRDSDGGWLRRR